jgi:hypothetical protein
LADDETLFYVAASLSGNDATGGVCDCGRIDAVVKELLLRRRQNKFAAAPLEDSDDDDGKDQDKKKKEDVGATEKKEEEPATKTTAAPEWKWNKYLKHATVKASAAAYMGAHGQRYESSPFAATHLPTVKLWSTLGPLHETNVATAFGGPAHPVWTKNTAELELFLQLYCSGSLSAQHLPKLLSNLSFEGLEPFEFGAVPTALPPMQVLPTFKQVDAVEHGLLRQQRAAGGCAAVAEEKKVDQPGASAYPSWYTVRTTFSAAQKEELCATTFSHQHKKTAGTTSSSSSSSFHDAILWLVHPALYLEELMPVVALQDYAAPPRQQQRQLP